MTKTTSAAALMVGLLLAGGTAHAQTPAASDSRLFASINVGAQLQTRTFSNTSTFTVFGEPAAVATAQGVGRGFVFDIGGGYRLSDRFAVAIGLWTQSGSGNAAIAGSIPDPLFFGHPKPVAATQSDLKQTDVGLNFQLVWMRPLTDKIDLAIAGGPTVIHVSQQIGALAIAANTQNAVPTTVTESKTTAKAGNIGVDVSYKLTDRYGAGAFVRYAGGKAKLPSTNLTVGGVQLGIGARIRF